MGKTENMEFSWIAERWVMEQLRKRGYGVRINPDYSARAWDLTLDGGMRVEVKSSNRRLVASYVTRQGVVRRYPRYKWNCRSIMGTTGEFPVVLIAHTLAGANRAFVVPASIIRGRGSLYPTISNHPDKYGGWLAHYLDRWSVVAQILRDWSMEQGQVEMFGEVFSCA